MSVETGILDALTAKPTSYLFNTQPPACRSEAARKMAAGFSYKSHLSPMVYSSEAGLVLYERVVTGNQEDQMLKKLSRPKAVRQPAQTSKPVPPSVPPRPDVMSIMPCGPGSASTSASTTPGGGSSTAGSTTGLYVPPRKQYTAMLKSDLDLERAAQTDWFHKQRATMTAAHVFTWGGRFRFTGPSQPVSAGAALAHQWTPGRQRAPLRLDKTVDE